MIKRMQERLFEEAITESFPDGRKTVCEAGQIETDPM
jgi:hypothetical protein